MDVDIVLFYFNVRYEQAISIFKILNTCGNTIKALLPLLLVDKLMPQATWRLCLFWPDSSIGSFDCSVQVLVSAHLEFLDFLYTNKGK